MPTICTVTGQISDIFAGSLGELKVEFSSTKTNSYRAGESVISVKDLRTKTDANGVLTIDLLPGEYIMRLITSSRRKDETTIVVPEAASATLAQLIELPPPDDLDAAEQAVLDAQTARDVAVQAASDAAAIVPELKSFYRASVYARAASQPAAPTGGSYNFDTDVLTPPAGFFINVPGSDGNPCWVTSYMFTGTGGTGTDVADAWSSPTLLVQDGSDGADGVDGAVGPEGPQGIQGIQGQKGDTGDVGPQGPQGPAGADGTNGLNGTDGSDGLDGVDGDDGDDGWSPIFAVVSDGTRRVHQIIDWTGGTGTKPASGQYVGATGLVAAIEDAVDIRGATGAAGSGGSGSGDMVKAVYDTNDNGIVDAAEAVPWAGVSDKPTEFDPAAHSHVWTDIGLNQVNIWGGLRHRSDLSSGYIDFGPANDSFAHIYTNLPGFYFNKPLVVSDKEVALNGGPFSYKLDDPSGLRGVFVPHPEGAVLDRPGTVTGAIKIALPLAGTTDMLKFWVDISEFLAGEVFSILVSGYYFESPGGNVWAQESATIIGQRTDQNFNVRFGHDGTNPCIWIGEVNSSWHFPKVVVRDLHAAHTADVEDWESGWSADLVTAFGTVEETVSSKFVIAENALKLDGLTSEELLQQIDPSPINDQDDLNNVPDGWYVWGPNEPTGSPFPYATCIQTTDPGQPIQLAYGGPGQGRMAVRRKDAGVWYDWTFMVDAERNQSIGGVKTFTDSIVANENISIGKELVATQILGSAEIVLSGTNVTIDLSQGTRFQFTPTGTAVITLDPTNFTGGTGREATAIIEIVNTGNHAITWAAVGGVTLRTPGGVQPDAPASGQSDIYVASKKTSAILDLFPGHKNMAAI